MDLPGCSVTVRGWRVRGREQHTFAWPLGCTVMHSLLLFGLDGKGGKREKDQLPVPLTEVVGNVVQVSYGPWT